ncbi:hypothetical protein IMZ48_11940 [Candidatus Bathyarchaeota archaeon]|nr:hypothetical protein [Candidatus Bathyarchaeota archaeon]
MSTIPFAIIATFASSGIRAYKAVAYGQVFDILSKFGAGKISGQEALRDVSTWCLVLTGMGIGVWLSNSMFMHMWIVFGEGQARSVRREVFGSLLGKDMAWYDGQADGTPSLLVQIET